MFEMNLR